jgi:hypothetical protein
MTDRDILRANMSMIKENYCYDNTSYDEMKNIYNSYFMNLYRSETILKIKQYAAYFNINIVITDSMSEDDLEKLLLHVRNAA